jgi:2-oxoglutarate dehydrogenase E2 component (dihydrolipoamide succinyltransferase)
MATEVKIPSLGESISSGILATWHVKSGDYVEADQPIFELETDKITSEGNAEVSGVIELKADEGDEVEVGSVIAVIDENASKPEEKDSGDEEEESTDKDDDSVKEADADSGDEDDEDRAESLSEKDSDKDRETDIKEKETEKDGKSGEDHQHPASVRRLAEESGIDPDSVKGSGKGGRVTKGDMLKAIEEAEKDSGKEKKGKEKQPADKAPSADSGNKEGRESRKKMTPLRKTIAKRLVSAQQSTAMLTTFNEVDMSAVMNFRKMHQDAFVKKHEVKLGFMSFFTKAVVHALKAYPGINARIDGDEIVTNHYFDVGIAVSTPKGLLVPVIRDCDQKSFAQIEKDIIEYANRAKNGKITIEDLQGGVFTITNGGIFGSMLSTPILNTPQSGILGMHTIQERPVAVNGEVTIRPMMYLALSYDHRLVDGREAVGFLVTVKQVIEDPMRLMFEI